MLFSIIFENQYKFRRIRSTVDAALFQSDVSRLKIRWPVWKATFRSRFYVMTWAVDLRDDYSKGITGLCGEASPMEWNV